MCEHTVLKCSNCNEAHKANSSECAVFKALKSHSSSIDSLAIAAKKGARNTERAVINASTTQTSLSFIKKDIDKIAQEE